MSQCCGVTDDAAGQRMTLAELGDNHSKPLSQLLLELNTCSLVGLAGIQLVVYYYGLIIKISPPKSFGKSHIATPHGTKWTCSLRVLAVQCPLKMSPVTVPWVRHIHTAVPVPHSA